MRSISFIHILRAAAQVHARVTRRLVGDAIASKKLVTKLNKLTIVAIAARKWRMSVSIKVTLWIVPRRRALIMPCRGGADRAAKGAACITGAIFLHRAQSSTYCAFRMFMHPAGVSTLRAMRLGSTQSKKSTRAEDRLDDVLGGAYASMAGAIGGQGPTGKVEKLHTSAPLVSPTARPPMA